MFAKLRVYYFDFGQMRFDIVRHVCVRIRNCVARERDMYTASSVTFISTPSTHTAPSLGFGHTSSLAKNRGWQFTAYHVCLQALY